MEKAQEKQEVRIKLPIRVEEFLGLPEGCEECLKNARAEALNLELDPDSTISLIENRCPDCDDSEDNEDLYSKHDSFDYPRADEIRNFFGSGVDKRTGKDTTTVLFTGSRLIRYQLPIEEFIDKYQKATNVKIIE